MIDDLELENLYFVLEASFGVLATYPLLYHGCFMYFFLIYVVCEG
jgi:hypothetical protein